MSKKIKTLLSYFLGFLILPFLLTCILLFPFIPTFKTWGLSNLYYLLKPYGLQIFGSKSAMWGYMGVLSAAIGLFVGFLYEDWQRIMRAKNLVKSLREEILNNIQLLFTGEVERPFYYNIFDTIKNEYSEFIVNINRFRLITALYDELRYYREIVKYWRVNNYGDIVTERQLGVCLKYIEYFEGRDQYKKTSKYIKNPVKDSYQKKRGRAIKVKNTEFNKWEKKLNSNLKRIFEIKDIEK